MNEGSEMVMPTARSQGLVVEHLAGETLIYDLERDEAHHLNPAAAAIFALSDGQTTPSQLALRVTERLGEPVSTQAVGEAIEQLAELGLLSQAPHPGVEVSRREVVRKAALVGAGAAVAGPVIKSIVAPTPAMAQSPCQNNGENCLTDSECCSGCCANDSDPESGQCINPENPQLCGGPRGA